MAILKRLFGGGTKPRAGGASRAEPSQPSDVGIFAGLFVATPEAVEGWDMEATGLTPATWPAMEFKNLESVKLGMLESILTGVAYDDIDQDDLHNLVREGGPEGPWVSRVRQPLVDALAAADDSRIGPVAAAWADTDEFKARPSDQPSRATIDELSGLLAEMAGLARVGKERAEPMYLMVGL
jgi:hypothetical protein